ncbi:IclR family transcriptional regulator [Bacillus sp. V3B]|uniref:IclR family transcriptional regulator n=1 Tax=Bacillus sp. V3B TaxID=2804915 RepID=UPI00210E3BB5|nr:IclR family transcriptional regulator [Bacillus sp. V3B]MCQ6274153.1 IclR family transcriptional regulator [Bacillus sp. V3B]
MNEVTRASSMTNALRLLNLFTMDEPELTLSELAEKLDVGPSTIYRLTNTLIHEGFLTRDQVSKNFRLGSLLLSMGHIMISSNDICEKSPLILEKLVEDTGETVHLSILEDNKTVYLQKFECSNYVHLLTHVGKKNPAHCTSTGQVMLAFQTEEQIKKVIKAGLPPLTSNTITDPIKFKERLTIIRKQGYSYNKDEFLNGVSAIAAPVKSPSGKVEFSMSIAGPTSRINSCSVPTLSKLVINAADKLTKKLRCSL